MSSSQTTKKLRRRDIARMPHLLARAVWELARARMALGAIGANDIERLNIAAKAAASQTEPTTQDHAFIEQVGFLVTFASRHLPWRSDCLPQAMAAQSWLLAEGLDSEIRIGVGRPGNGEFGAHAWLVLGDQIVTGGETGQYSVLLGSEFPTEEPFTPANPPNER